LTSLVVDKGSKLNKTSVQAEDGSGSASIFTGTEFPDGISVNTIRESSPSAREPQAPGAAPWTNAERIYASDPGGATALMAAGDEYPLLSENGLSAQAWGTPALADGRIYLRTVDHLHCIEDQSEAAPGLPPVRSMEAASLFDVAHRSPGHWLNSRCPFNSGQSVP
jgi:hypothetical protein